MARMQQKSFASNHYCCHRSLVPMPSNLLRALLIALDRAYPVSQQGPGRIRACFYDRVFPMKCHSCSSNTFHCSFLTHFGYFSFYTNFSVLNEDLPKKLCQPKTLPFLIMVLGEITSNIIRFRKKYNIWTNIFILHFFLKEARVCHKYAVLVRNPETYFKCPPPPWKHTKMLHQILKVNHYFLLLILPKLAFSFGQNQTRQSKISDLKICNGYLYPMFILLMSYKFNNKFIANNNKNRNYHVFIIYQGLMGDFMVNSFCTWFRMKFDLTVFCF